MTGEAALDAAGAVALLCEVTSERYALVGRLQGGETGAHEVTGPSGERLVLKWDQDTSNRTIRTDAVALAERLRTEAGWPVPRQWVIDDADIGFYLQVLLAGHPVSRLSHRLVDELLALHERRLGLAKPGDPQRWPDTLTKTLTVGGVGYCRHDSLRGFDTRTARVLDRIEEIGAALDEARFPNRDVVHWDLHLGNVLGDSDGGLTAVVDNDFMLVGDASFDLVTLYVSSLGSVCDDGVVSRLKEVSIDQLDEHRRDAYLAHLFLRYVDWAIRAGREQTVPFWLDHAEPLLGI